VSLRFLEEAAHEFHRAIQYYEDESAGLGGELLTDVERLEDLLVSNPDVGSPGESGTRRLLLHRFPFLLIQVLVDGEPLVVAVAHQRRKPGSW
jgi:hypothetical protein